MLKRLAFAAAVLVGAAVLAAGVGADDGAALVDRLNSQPFDGSGLENGSQFLDAGHSEVGAELGSHGVVGLSWLRIDDRDGAGTVLVLYYVFSSPAAADAYPANYVARMRQANQPGWTADLPIKVTDSALGEIAGSCIASDTVDHANCMFRDTGGLPVVIQISVWRPDLTPDMSDQARRDAIAQRVARAAWDVMSAARRHLASAGGAAAASQVASDPAAIGERLLKQPFDTALVGEGYRFTEAFSVTGSAVPEGWDMTEMVIFDFTGPDGEDDSGRLYAGYMIFASADAARTYYEQYPDQWKGDAGAQGWAELETVANDLDPDPIRKFRVPCMSGGVDKATACLDYVTGTPVIIGVSMPLPPLDGMSADDRANATALDAVLVVSALLPAARAHLAEAMTPAQ